MMSEEQGAPEPVWPARNQRDEPFRIRVSLQRYFSDERARCYLLVSGASSVGWLEARLRQEFALRGPMRLLSAGHLLPRAESLALLRPDDSVDVIPVLASEDAENGRGGKLKKWLDTPAPSAEPAPLATPADETLLLRRNLSLTDTNGEDEEADALQHSKRRALSLLDRLESGEPRRRRRRVHCRRRRVTPFADAVPEPAPEPAPASAPEPAPASAPDVVRGGATRSPRRVVPLQEAPAAPLKH